MHFAFSIVLQCLMMQVLSLVLTELIVVGYILLEFPRIHGWLRAHEGCSDQRFRMESLVIDIVQYRTDSAALGGG